MSYIIKIACASVRGDAYARANSIPESDDPSPWVILPPLAVARTADGRLTYAVSDDVAVFPSYREARLWKARRVAYQRSRKRSAAKMQIANLAEVRTGLRGLR